MGVPGVTLYLWFMYGLQKNACLQKKNMVQTWSRGDLRVNFETQKECGWLD